MPSIDRTTLLRISTSPGCSNLAKMSHITAVSKLRGMLQQPEKVVVAPGVFDGLSARIAVSLGFDVLYMVLPNKATTQYRDEKVLLTCEDRSRDPHVPNRLG